MTEQRPARDREGFARHLEGWQVGAILVAIACLSALLAVPRPVAPEQLPLPNVSETDLQADVRSARALARDARATGLSFEARTVGEYLRKLGNAEYAARGAPAPGLADRLADVQGSVAGFRRAGGQAADRELHLLRAIQGELFVTALGGRGPQQDARELGGAFTNAPAHAPWFNKGRFVGGDVEAWLLFKARWNRVTRLDEVAEHELRPAEWLALVRFLLQHPEGSDSRAQTRSQLTTLEVLAKRQPEYPVAFARGTVLFRDGAYELAAVAFQEHLETHPTGDWSLRARNHLLAAREQHTAPRSEE